MEIVEGFIKVSEITDKVIKIIKNSDNSKKGVIQNLQTTFHFTKLQATAIEELRLYRLSRIDQLQYQEEKIPTLSYKLKSNHIKMIKLHFIWQCGDWLT